MNKPGMKSSAGSGSASRGDFRRFNSSHKSRWLALTMGLVVIMTGIAFSSGGQIQMQSRKQGIADTAMRQIEALMAEKESRTPAQQRIDSQLLYAIKMDRQEPIAPGVETLEVDVGIYSNRQPKARRLDSVEVGIDPLKFDEAPHNDESMVEVDITAYLGGRVLDEIRAAGGTIINSLPAYNTVRALLPVQSLEGIAADRDVKFIQPKQEFTTSRAEQGIRLAAPYTKNRDLAPGFAWRAERVRENLGRLLQTLENATGQGSKTSEGDATHRAATARATFGINGSGVKIGVLSNGVTNLAASQALGDLGPVTVLTGQTGTGDEGTAMLEIIHDLAPGAQLFFATANPTITQFAQNIRDLRAMGCDVICDDVFYFVETPFQDGQLTPSNTNGGAVIQAVNDVTALGAMYFSSAGNEGNILDGTAGVWEGDFVDGGAATAPLPAGNVHSFGAQNFNTILANGSLVNLYWSDPLGGSSNDYDLFRLNAAGTAISTSSTNIQNGTQDPYEQISSSTVNNRVVILKKVGAQPRFLHLNSQRGRFSISTTGQTHGHSSAAAAFSCAATPANLAFGAPPNPIGPFPNPFNSGNRVELFSSDGPRRIFFNPDGSAITPNNFSSTGGVQRQKPDITAADGVSDTGVGGFPTTFYGTSAAAPHAGAIAGLIKSAGPFSNAQIKTALLSTAIDIQGAGTDINSGVGIVMAFEALNFLGVAGQANIEQGAVAAVENPGNGNGTLDPGEGGKLTVQLTNSGVLNATGVSATLTTATPGVTITQPAVSAYPDLHSLGGSASNTTPFTFTLASNFPCAGNIDFTLTVSYVGGPSPKTFAFTVNTAPPPTVITTVLDATTPPTGTGFTSTTGTQTGRIFRANPAGSCGVTKVFPGTGDVLSHSFDAYTFTTCASSAPYCVTVTLTNGCTGNKQLFDAVYLTSFDPANIGTNYVSDAAASNTVGGPITFNATIPGGSKFVVVVADVNTGVNSAVGCSYTLSVSGACLSCQTPNQPPSAQCHAVTVSAGPSCTATASINNGSSDPEGGMLTLIQSPAGPYPLGTTSVLLTVIDDKGATSQCSASVTVVDTTPPSITCPGNITKPADSGACQTAVTFANPTVSDTCSTVGTPTCNPASGSVFQKGTTTVNCSVSDSAGNNNSCSFTVTVTDTQAPTIVCPPDIKKLTANPGDVSVVVTFPTPAFADTCTGATIVCTPPSGSAFPIGQTIVHCTVTDTSGNTASCSFKVRVYDYVVYDTARGLLLRICSADGSYEFFDCRKGDTLTGIGVMSFAGCKATLTDTGGKPSDRSVTVTVNKCTKAGTASIVFSAGSYQLSDSNMSDSPFSCTGP